MRLKDNVAIVAGGAHGMGEAETRLFAAEGARDIVADILENEPKIVAADIRDGASDRRRLYCTMNEAIRPMARVEYVTNPILTKGRKNERQVD